MDSQKSKSKSGAQKRQEKKRKEFENLATSSSKITKFYKININNLSESDPTSPSTSFSIAETAGAVTTSVLKEQDGISKPHEPHHGDRNSDTELVRDTPVTTQPLETLSKTFAAPADCSVSVSGFEKSTKTTGNFGVENDHVIAMGSSNSSFVPFESFNPFTKPKADEIGYFFSCHPNQPESSARKKLPFDTRKVYYRTESGDIVPRQWVTYSEEKGCLFCSLCLVYGSGRSVFSDCGFKEWKHTYQRIEEHEKSLCHYDATKSYMTQKSGKNLPALFNTVQKDMRDRMVEKNRILITRVIEVVKFLGKQGLPYRGHRNESAYSLENVDINHGNFLETIMLLSEFDHPLKSHLDEVIDRSKKMRLKYESKENKSVASGRGNLLTFLSSTTVQRVIQAFGKEILKRISDEIRMAKIYSITMDCTTDISTMDQCVIVLRYVSDQGVSERVVALKHALSSTGKSLTELIKFVLSEIDVPLEGCIADAFDGASNMSGEYNGVQAHLAQMSPNHIHTWCYAHILNLVISDSAQCVIPSISFFSLLQSVHVFLTESYKRLQIFVSECSENEIRSRRLNAIGATRWRSKNDAAVKIFGRFDMWASKEIEVSGGNLGNRNRKMVYIELIQCLDEISESCNFTAKVRHEAKNLFCSLCKYETILVAMVFLRIFSVTTPLSDYLQTRNLDYVQSWRQTSTTLLALKTIQRDFKTVKLAADAFVTTMNKHYENTDLDIVVDSNLPVKRKKQVVVMPGEEAKHENIGADEIENFRLSVYNVIMDRVINSIETRFDKHKELYEDLECFDPRNFKKLTKGIPNKSLLKICQLIPSIDYSKLREELQGLARLWPNLCKPTVDCSSFSVAIDNEWNTDDSNELETDSATAEADPGQDFYNAKAKLKDLKCKENFRCNACVFCVYLLLKEYNMYSLEFQQLYMVYKYLLTIPLTQVSCERAFSKLKLIKTRLRNTMVQPNLESLFLMNSEREIVNKIDPVVIISRLTENSSVLRHALT